jgi:predicted nucleic-acid-binding protein
MIGLDTNVLVRYLAKDDPIQTPVAVKLVRSLSAEEPSFLSLVAITELIWVLRMSYRYRNGEIANVVETLLRSRELIVEQEELVADALRSFAAGSADFADYLIERTGQLAGCIHTFTFDKRAATFAGMRLLK